VYALDGDQAWLPVSALNVSNADISAHFLAQNSVLYLAPVQDPWLSANQLFNESEPGLELILYGPDEYVSVMACTDQYQICNPTTSPYDCTIIGSQKDLREGSRQIGLNPYQLATERRLGLALEWTSTYQTVVSLSNTALLARDRLVDFIGIGVPPNQWQLEVQGWFETSLAKLQSYVVEYAANIADLGPTGSVLAPPPDGDAETQAALDQCSDQRIRNIGAYQSFSFLGLMIVVCVGLTIILLSWIVEPIVVFIRSKRRHNKHDYREIARIADQKLQLHRMALQGAGHTQGWDPERIMDETPVTTRNTLFPAPFRHKVNNEDGYRYSAVPTAANDDDDDDEDDVAADAGDTHGQPMTEISNVPPPHPSPQPHPSRPWNGRATPSEQPLMQHNGQWEGDQNSAEAVGSL
jgi:hypothetical protein